MINRFQILSLDGGGLKGLFSAAMLAHFEEDLGVKITDYFDLITGTSTGGIIALGLGLGMRPSEMVKFYIKDGPKIFGCSSMGWFSNRYDNRALKSSLQKCFDETTLGESQKRLIIPTYNLGEDDVYLFKTPHHPRLKRDFKAPMWKVAMATSAAPTYFSTFKEIDDVRLVDGGVWANNPSLVGLAEAVSMLDVPLGAISILSLGTTSEVLHRPSKLDDGGVWQWKKDAVDVVMRGQSVGAYTQTIHLLGQGKVLRIDPKVPDKLFNLDAIPMDDLKAKASHVSRIYCPKIEERFLEHVAEEVFPYKPLYQVGGNDGNQES